MTAARRAEENRPGPQIGVHQPGQLPPLERAGAGQRRGYLVDLTIPGGVDERTA